MGKWSWAERERSRVLLRGRRAPKAHHCLLRHRDGRATVTHTTRRKCKCGRDGLKQDLVTQCHALATELLKAYSPVPGHNSVKVHDSSFLLAGLRSGRGTEKAAHHPVWL